MSEKHNTYDEFKKVLIENGAEFSDSFIANLLRIIQHMRPNKGTSGAGGKSGPFETETDALSMKFPGLAIPNEPQKQYIDTEEVGTLVNSAYMYP